MIQIERLNSSEYAPKKGLVYFDTADLHGIYQKAGFKGNHILVGPKGIGKSLSVQSFAAKINCPVVTYDCSEDVRRSNLIGAFVIRGQETPFILGPIPTAFEIANERGACILILEEINALTPQMQKVLNAATDFRRRIEVPECQRVFRLIEDAKLWIVGTMNFSIYGGVYSLNEDLKSRFRMIPVSYPKRVDEVKTLKGLLNPFEAQLPPGTVERLVLLAHETRQGALEYALSTRDLFQIGEDIANLGLHRALWMSSGKFEGEDVDAYKKRVESIFDGVQFDGQAEEKAPRGKAKQS